MSGVFHIGHLQAGAAHGRALLVTRGPLRQAQLTATSGSYRCAQTLDAAPIDSPFAAALAARNVAVFSIELPGPIPEADIELKAALGDLVVRRAARPIPARIGEGGVSFVVGSCLYPNATYLDTLARALDRAAGPAEGRGDWSIADPRFAIFLGDNVYADVHPDRVEGNAAEHTAALYAKAFLEREASARALSCLPAISLVDDHEMYDGYPELEPHVMRTWLPSVRKGFVDAAQQAIATFQTGKNPPGERSFAFDIGPLSLFGLDTRIARTRIRIDTPRLTAEADLSRFERWAAGLRGPGLLFLAQPIFCVEGSFIEPSYRAFTSDYGRILRALRDAPFDIGVIAGDLHTSRVLELDVGGRRITELVSSPLVRVPSFVPNLMHRLWGGTEDQEAELVDVPHGVLGSEVDMQCAAYVMGTAAPNSFALLRARVSGDDVVVEVELVDHAANRLAKCERDRGGRVPRVALGLPCATSFRLSRRATSQP